MPELHNNYTEFLVTWYAGFTSEHLRNVRKTRSKLYAYVKFKKLPHIVGDGVLIVFGKENADQVEVQVRKLIKMYDPEGSHKIDCSKTKRLLPTKFLFKNPESYDIGLGLIRSTGALFSTNATMVFLIDPGYELAYQISNKLRHKLEMPQDLMCTDQNGAVTAVISRFGNE